jgi:hypothetical protein
MAGLSSTLQGAGILLGLVCSDRLAAAQLEAPVSTTGCVLAWALRVINQPGRS